MTGDGRLAGVVLGACSQPLELDPATIAVLALLGDQLAIGIAAAACASRSTRPRSSASADPARRRGARRPGAGPGADPPGVRPARGPELTPEGQASRARLREAAAPRTGGPRPPGRAVGGRPAGEGSGLAIGETCDRFVRRGMSVDLAVPARPVATAPKTTATPDPRPRRGLDERREARRGRLGSGRARRERRHGRASIRDDGPADPGRLPAARTGTWVSLSHASARGTPAARCSSNRPGPGVPGSC